LHHHRNVYEAIEAGSSEKARGAMAGHLREAEHTMRRVLAAETKKARVQGRRASQRRAAAPLKARSSGRLERQLGAVTKQLVHLL